MQRSALAFLGFATCLIATEALPASIKERTTYFSVRGTTLEQLDRDLGRKGPTAGSSQRHPGATQVKFGGTVTYSPSGTRCRIGRVDFSLDLVKILPRWNKPRSASAATGIIWRTLAQDIARHEEDHARIARSYVKRMETAVRNLGTRRSCEELEAAVNATTTRYLREHEREQRAFDAREGREVGWRLRRLLRQNIDEARAATN